MAFVGRSSDRRSNDQVISSDILSTGDQGAQGSDRRPSVSAPSETGGERVDQRPRLLGFRLGLSAIGGSVLPQGSAESMEDSQAEENSGPLGPLKFFLGVE